MPKLNQMQIYFVKYAKIESLSKYLADAYTPEKKYFFSWKHFVKSSKL